MTKIIRCGMLILAFFGLASIAHASEPGHGFEVRAYVVELRPDLASGSISGRQSIELVSNIDGLDMAVFSPNPLAIKEVSIGGIMVEHQSTDRGIAVTLPHALHEGESASIDLVYSGLPKRGVTPTVHGLITGYFACDWMICLQDEPGDKAAFDLSLYLPAEAKSFSAGHLVEVKPVAPNLVRHRWKSIRDTSAYLFSFAAGDFQSQLFETPQGDLLIVDATNDNITRRELADRTTAMIEFFAERAGLPLPNGRYTQIVVPGYAAQETAGFSIIGGSHLGDARNDPGNGWAVAHELAHQWWGNLITCASWKDFWLNEGFATFMVAAWKEHYLGRAAYEHELQLFERRRERLRKDGYDKPLTWTGEYPTLSHRRAVQYSKGGLFLAELRDHLGEDVFWRGIAEYTRLFAGKTVESKDFQNVLERTSGRDLTILFSDWVYGNE